MEQIQAVALAEIYTQAYTWGIIGSIDNFITTVINEKDDRCKMIVQGGRFGLTNYYYTRFVKELERIDSNIVDWVETGKMVNDWWAYFEKCARFRTVSLI